MAFGSSALGEWNGIRFYIVYDVARPPEAFRLDLGVCLSNSTVHTYMRVGVLAS